MIKDPYIEWLRAGLAQPGKSQSGLARALNLHPSAISKILSNRRRFTSGELTATADYLGLPAPTSELRLSPQKGEPLPVAGRVAAGIFREVDDFDQSPTEWITLPPDPEFPDARRMAFDVEGLSMNNLKPRPILDGDRAICVDFSDIADRVKIRTGMIVVVQRSSQGGQMLEWSLKQVEFYPDRIEFCPRSTEKKYKPIVVPHDYQADDGTSIEIIGLLRNVISGYAY